MQYLIRRELSKSTDLQQLLTRMFTLLSFGVILVSITVPVVAQLRDGNLCINYDGTQGICRNARECTWAIMKIRENEITPQQLVRCGFTEDDKTIICCNEGIISVTRPPTPRPLQTRPGDSIVFRPDMYFDYDKLSTTQSPPPTRNNEGKADQACELIKRIVIHELTYHITKGRPVEHGELPHMAAIAYRDSLENKVNFNCGGTLIAKNFILTAAHCVNSRIRRPEYVRLGKLSLLDEEDDDADHPAQEIKVKKVHIHNNYTSSQKYNDIALLELEHDVEYTIAVQPACLSTSKAIDSRSNMIVSGWGKEDANNAGNSNWLLKANQSYVTNDECDQKYKAIYQRVLKNGIIESQLCAFDPLENADACQGDSGGPLQVKLEDYRYYVVGVTSFGASCGTSFPGIYSRVSEFLDWIEDIVWPNNVEI